MDKAQMLAKIYVIIQGHEEGVRMTNDELMQNEQDEVYYDEREVIRFGDIIQWLDGEGISPTSYKPAVFHPSKDFLTIYYALCRRWDNYSKKLDEQNGDCIKYVYDLVCNA